VVLVFSGLLITGTFGKLGVDCPHMSLDWHVRGESGVIRPRFACSSRRRCRRCRRSPGPPMAAAVL